MSNINFIGLYQKCMSNVTFIKFTPSVPVCLSSILFWNVPKYCPVSKNKSH